VPTFTVDSLADLQRRLERRDTALGWGAYGSGTLSLASSDSDGDDGAGVGSGMAGAPPEGLDFLDALLAGGALNVRRCRGAELGACMAGAGAGRWQHSV
jgi:hypothetical protein